MKASGARSCRNRTFEAGAWPTLRPSQAPSTGPRRSYNSTLLLVTMFQRFRDMLAKHFRSAGRDMKSKASALGINYCDDGPAVGEFKPVQNVPNDEVSCFAN